MCTEINDALCTCSPIEADGVMGEGKVSGTPVVDLMPTMPRLVKLPGHGPEPPLNTNRVFNTMLSTQCVLSRGLEMEPQRGNTIYSGIPSW